MRRTFLPALLCFAASSLVSAQTTNASTGLSFLKLGIGGRAIGMGEAYSALSTDASGVYYNPAGISFGSGNEVTLMHKEWIFGTSTEYLGATIHPGNFALGLGLNSTNVDDIEIRQEPGPSQGTFGLHDFAVSATASWRIDTSLSVGITGKFLYEKIFVDEASGTAFDFGARYRVDDNFAVALAVSNLGSTTPLLNESIELPSGVRAGVAYENTLGNDLAYTLASDVIKVFDDNGTRIHLGGEIAYNSSFALRGGYQIGYEAKGLSAGFGVRLGIIQFDYAFVPFLDELGNTHTFALTFNL